LVLSSNILSLATESLMRLNIVLAGFALSLLMPASAFALDPAKAPAAPPSPPAVTNVAPAPVATSSFSDAQRTEIQNIIKDYLTKDNPEVLMDSMKELQKREQAKAEANAKTAISGSHDKIFNDPNSPVGGNPKGDVTVVEFFDYQCPYCKMSEPKVQQLLKDDKNIRYVYKEFPVLGPSSTLAAKAALASVRQDKYIKFSSALMAAPFSHGARPQEDEELVYKTAKTTGLDVDKLKKDMNDPAIGKMVEDNIALGAAIGAHGTPSFVIGDQLYPGALETDQLKKAVADARAANKKP